MEEIVSIIAGTATVIVLLLVFFGDNLIEAFSKGKVEVSENELKTAEANERKAQAELELARIRSGQPLANLPAQPPHHPHPYDNA